ncbi:MAG TPA: hypothetical protein VFW02_00325 [Candidatus Limnocylindrales bacterium]|nr:hypothetical protein [Candidatus Limnocylindrales bacterium]
MTRAIEVYTETGAKRVFAGALAWPGWCRSARDEAGALAALVDYWPRYAAVLTGSGLSEAFEAPTDSTALSVVERLRGGAGTDFGAPGAAPAADEAALDAKSAERQAAILRACWTALDGAAAAAQGVTLRTGPRGGGRDLSKMLGHVLEAEQAYLLKLGSRPPKGDGSAAHVAALREAAVAAFTARALGRPVPDPSQTKVLWSPRYYVRRAAWHVLDHAWEIEDRAQPE